MNLFGKVNGKKTWLGLIVVAISAAVKYLLPEIGDLLPTEALLEGGKILTEVGLIHKLLKHEMKTAGAGPAE